MQETTIAVIFRNSEWVLASDIENNSALWHVMVNGFIVDARGLPLEMQIYCAEMGLIPYVPALKNAVEEENAAIED